jgi:hypothetical protein
VPSIALKKELAPLKASGVAGGVAQAVEYLPYKHEALSSNPSNHKKNLKRLLG